MELLKAPEKENGIAPQSKKPRVYAVQDFPEGCGPFAARVKPSQLVNSMPPLVYAVRDYLKGCGVDQPKSVDCKKSTKEMSLVPCFEAEEGGHRRVVSHGSNGASVVDKDCNRVKKALAAFRQVLIENDRERRADRNKQKTMKDYTEAATYLKKQGKWVNTKKRTGHIPGVKIGDKFQYRAELAVVGLHTQFQSGIDYMKLEDKKPLATSIVESGRYSNTTVSRDVMTYTGEGGNPKVSKGKPKDQKAERGNLALMNSKEARTPVRVIRSYKLGDESGYVYDGLYMVEDFWQERGDFDKLVFKFLLTRMSEQPKLTLAWQLV